MKRARWNGRRIVVEQDFFTVLAAKDLLNDLAEEIAAAEHDIKTNKGCNRCGVPCTCGAVS